MRGFDPSLLCSKYQNLGKATKPSEKTRTSADSTLTSFFDEGKEDLNSTKSGPASVRKRKAILMAFRWRVDDGPTLNAGLVAL